MGSVDFYHVIQQFVKVGNLPSTHCVKNLDHEGHLARTHTKDWKPLHVWVFLTSPCHRPIALFGENMPGLTECRRSHQECLTR